MSFLVPPAKDKALGPSLNSFPLPPRQKPVLRIRTSGTSNRSSPTEQNNMQKFSTVSFSNRPRAKSGNAKSLAIPSPLNLSSLTYRQSNTTDHESISKVSKMMIKSPKLTSPREIAESAKSEGLKAKRPSLLIGPNKLKSPRFLGYNQSPCTSSTGVFETNRHFLSNPNSPYPSPTMAEGLSRREFLSQYQNQVTDQRLKVKNLSPPLPLKIRKVRTKNFIETADTDDDDDEDETSPIFLRGEGSSSKNYFSSTGTDFTTLTIPSPPKNEFDSSAKSSSLKLLLSSQEEAEDIRSSTANKFSEFGEGDFGRTSCADQHEIVSYGMAI
ncbi:hypothetical protein BY996DRAFT_6416051 [Phakopsora pachyrhizi]|nr:hypothetical protein BY996DRAFT_6416051 [Phakopsora pachyrhizi]